MTTARSSPGDGERVAVLDEALQRERLARARIGRLGYVDDAGPAVVPINLAVDGAQRVVFHTVPDGPLARVAGSRVAVEIDGFDPAFRSGWSILVRGEARDVTDDTDPTALAARSMAVDCWAPGRRDRVIVVTPSSVTGRVIPLGSDGDWFAGIPARDRRR